MQPRTEHVVGEVGAGLGQVRDGVRLRGGAVPETGDLREDEPHPVARLPPCPQLGQGAVVGPVLVLRADEPLEVGGHVAQRGAGSVSGTGAPGS